MVDVQPQSGIRRSGTALFRTLVAIAGLVVVWQGIVVIFRPPPFMLPGIDGASQRATLGPFRGVPRVHESGLRYRTVTLRT